MWCDYYPAWVPPLVTGIALIGLLVLLPLYWNATDKLTATRHQLNRLLNDDGRLIDMLAERAKREIDEELGKQ